MCFDSLFQCWVHVETMNIIVLVVSYICYWKGNISHVEKTQNRYCKKNLKPYDVLKIYNWFEWTSEYRGFHFLQVETRDDLQHVMEPKILIGGFSCKICQKTFNRLKVFRRHVSTVHFAPQFQCNLCGHIFRRKDSLLRHKRQLHLTGENKI